MILNDEFFKTLEEVESLPKSNNSQNEKKPVGTGHQMPNGRKKKSKLGGYRPILVEHESDLALESVELESDMKLINERCLSDPLYMSSQDIVSYYVIVYLNQRCPNQMLQSRHELISSDRRSNSLLIQTSKPISQLGFRFKNKHMLDKLDKCNVKTLFDLVNTFNLHSVPHSARYTLANWYLATGNTPVDLVLFINKIPSSKQVLDLQASAKRCVTLISDKLDALVLGERDPFSFLLHDLVHAYKMFSNEYLLKGQIGFYKALLRIYAHEKLKMELKLLLKSDAQFSEEFDYLIADMNSHPRHLLCYLKAILINAFKRKFQLGQSQRLRDVSLDEFDRFFESILQAFNMSEEERQLARELIVHDEDNDEKISKPLSSIDFKTLDNFFLNII
jgi:hypothetical protein